MCATEGSGQKMAADLGAATGLHARLRAAMQSLPDESADGLLRDLDALLDGEMAMMAEVCAHPSPATVSACASVLARHRRVCTRAVCRCRRCAGPCSRLRQQLPKAARPRGARATVRGTPERFRSVLRSLVPS